jgi:pimeloyl-ACP methyl ester carboxylesterase
MSRAKEDMERLRLSGGDIEYSDRGDGQPILLVHAGVFADWFLPLAASPVLEGFRVIRMRRAGYTSGSLPAEHLSIGAHGRHCAALLDTLGIEQAHVVGHSSSALMAVELAADRPELVRSLVLVEPASAPSLASPADAEIDRRVLGPALAAAAAGDVGTAFDTFMSIVCAPDYREVLEAALGPDGLRAAERDSEFFFADEVAAVLEWSFDKTVAGGVRQPVLLLQGGASPPPVHHVVARLATWLPQAQVKTVDDADHLLPLRDPATLAELTADFANQH